MGCKSVILGLLLSFGLFAGVCFGKYSGGTGEPNAPYLIATPNDLNEIGSHPEDFNDCFILVNDIDMAAFTYTTALIAPDTNSSTAGFQGTTFTGIFHGNDCNITNLTIDTAGAKNWYLGLFGQIGQTGEVKDLGIEDANITGGNYSYYLGGLCGYNYKGTINNCYATGPVTGGVYSYWLGGLCGYNYKGTINNCCATGSVTGGDYSECLGGLCGQNCEGTISNCYATGDVTGGYWPFYLGGLCGYNYNGTINNCYATGSVTGGDTSLHLGGLCGDNFAYYSNATIINCCATGSVTGGYNSGWLGGLCGENDSYHSNATIKNCYSSGPVTTGDNSLYRGGLCGENGDTISNCFWDIETSDCNVSDGGLGLPTAEMQTRSTFVNAGWDFVGESINGTEDIWRMCVDGVNYPKLSWEFLGYGDLTCPDGVDFIDYSILANEWQLERLEQDYNSDGRVNFKDWAIFANNWEGNYTELPPFVACWLARSARIADIAPTGGDDFVNWQDLATLAAHWLEGTE